MLTFHTILNYDVVSATPTSFAGLDFTFHSVLHISFNLPSVFISSLLRLELKVCCQKSNPEINILQSRLSLLRNYCFIL